MSALRSAKPLLIMLAISLFWLYLQSIVPYKGALYEWMLGQNFQIEAPQWYRPDPVWSVVPELTMDLFWSELTLFLACVLTISLVNSRQRLKQLLVVIFIVGLLHACVGIFAKYGSLLLVDREQMDGHFSAARAWFINRNHFAAFISLSLFAGLTFQLWWIIRFHGKSYLNLFVSQVLSYRIVVVLALLIGFVALSLSQSRSGFFAILVSLACVLLFYGQHSKLVGRRRVLLLPFIFVVALSMFYFGSELVVRFQVQGSFLGERVPQWQLTWDIIQQEWLLGYGANSYATVFQALRGDNEFREVLYNQAHNDYLHIWLEQGLLGLILWLSLMFLILKHAWLAFKFTSSSLVSATMIAASVVILAALLQSLVGFNLQILNIRFYFFVIIGLIYAVPKIRHKK
jgi:O-antigen ligase